MSKADAVLELSRVSKNFGGVQALEDCSFEVKKGLITSLIGPNGAGKTTAFNIVGGFVEPDKGKITLKDKDITKTRPDKISKLGISRSFQMARVFDNLTIEENLLLALREDSLFTAMFKSRTPSEEEKKDVQKALDAVGLEKPVETLASDLSYGQKRLLELARTVVKKHDVLLLDEPTAGINPKLREQLKGVLKRLKEDGNTILLIEHDMDFVMDMSDEVIVLEAGKQLMTGPPKQVRNDPRVLEAYLGE